MVVRSVDLPLMRRCHLRVCDAWMLVEWWQLAERWPPLLVISRKKKSSGEAKHQQDSSRPCLFSFQKINHASAHHQTQSLRQAHAWDQMAGPDQHQGPPFVGPPRSPPPRTGLVLRNTLARLGCSRNMRSALGIVSLFFIPFFFFFFSPLVLPCGFLIFYRWHIESGCNLLCVCVCVAVYN